MYLTRANVTVTSGLPSTRKAPSIEILSICEDFIKEKCFSVLFSRSHDVCLESIDRLEKDDRWRDYR